MMLAAMTSKGVVASQHHKEDTQEGFARALWLRSDLHILQRYFGLSLLLSLRLQGAKLEPDRCCMRPEGVPTVTCPDAI
jgi:hypothetical protein